MEAHALGEFGGQSIVDKNLVPLKFLIANFIVFELAQSK
jgi:hypothetical protein